jgi:hypothetical protein
MKKLFAVYFLAGTSIFNFINYGSPSPALESGVTAYFSYTKYHYLALPKMDMDVFLSGKNGAFSVTNGPFVPIGSTSAEVNSIYHKAAFESVVKYKKETVLGIMQKFDSYFFDVQKIPHLPGRYVLDQDQGIIKIENERITWPLVLGNALFLIFRTTLVISCLIGVGAFINSVLIHKWVDRNKFNLFPLALPYIFGAVPGLFVYTETRFKIVSELLLVPLVIQMWSLVFHSKKSTF